MVVIVCSVFLQALAEIFNLDFVGHFGGEDREECYSHEAADKHSKTRINQIECDLGEYFKVAA